MSNIFVRHSSNNSLSSKRFRSLFIFLLITCINLFRIKFDDSFINGEWIVFIVYDDLPNWFKCDFNLILTTLWNFAIVNIVYIDVYVNKIVTDSIRSNFHSNIEKRKCRFFVSAMWNYGVRREKERFHRKNSLQS